MSISPQKTQKLIKAKELSQRIPYSVSWIRLKVKQNAIPYYRIGRNILFDLEEVNIILRSNRIACASEMVSKIISERRMRHLDN